MKFLVIVFFGVMIISSCNRETPTKELNTIAQWVRNGEVGKALEMLANDFLERYPENTKGWILYAHLNQKANQDSMAMVAYKKAIETDSLSFEAHLGLGKLYKSGSNLDEASICYTKALKIRPENAKLMSSLSVIEMKRFNFDKAIKLGEQAVNLSSDDLSISANLAVVYHYFGEHQKRDSLYLFMKEQGYDKLKVLDKIFQDEISVFD